MSSVKKIRVILTLSVAKGKDLLVDSSAFGLRMTLLLGALIQKQTSSNNA